jgi:transcriptional antiterminator NusG
MSEKGWYALHVTTGFEKKALEFLRESIERFGKEGQFGEILLPMEKRLEMRRGEKRETEGKMFPGYLFIEMKMESECWHLVRNTKFVNGFIGGSYDSPRPLSDEEMGSIRQRIEAGLQKPVSMQRRFITGEQVRIKDGPFVDFNGTVETVNAERERLNVSVMVFGRSTPVELDFDQVEKV